MNFNNFTIKSQEAVQKAVEYTRESSNHAIEPVHLLKAIANVGDSLVNFIFQKVGASTHQLSSLIEREIASLPRVSGGEPYLSRESNEVLQKSLDIAKINGDEYGKIRERDA